MEQPTWPKPKARLVRVTLELTEDEILLLDSALTKLIEVKYHHMERQPGGQSSVSATYARNQFNALQTIRKQFRSAPKVTVERA